MTEVYEKELLSPVALQRSFNLQGQYDSLGESFGPAGFLPPNTLSVKRTAHVTVHGKLWTSKGGSWQQDFIGDKIIQQRHLYCVIMRAGSRRHEYTHLREGTITGSSATGVAGQCW